LRAATAFGTLRSMKSVFTQTITFRTDHPEELIAAAHEWDALQAQAEIMGFMEVRILADRDDPGRYVMINDFGVVDPNLTAAQEAYLNNERPQTQAFAERLGALTTGEVEWHHFDELYRTTFAAE
jgi:hypothetical protein